MAALAEAVAVVIRAAVAAVILVKNFKEFANSIITEMKLIYLKCHMSRGENLMYRNYHDGMKSFSRRQYRTRELR